MKHFNASDGIRLSYVVDDFTDPWQPKETLILLHAVLGSSRRFYAGYQHNITDAVPQRCAEELLRFLCSHGAAK